MASRDNHLLKSYIQSRESLNICVIMTNNKGKQNFKIVSGRRFDDFLVQTRLNLDPDEHVISIYDGAPAHRNPAIPAPNSELRKLPPYSPFLNIVEQAVSALKAAIKADISRPEIQVQMNDRAEARRQGLALGNYRTQLLLHSTTEEYWYHHCRQMWTVVQVFPLLFVIITQMFNDSRDGM